MNEINPNITKGIDSLIASIKENCTGEFNPNGDCQTKICGCFHNYCEKYKWVSDRAAHYAKALGLTTEEVVTMWENNRDYWYMNYYQDSQFPLLDDSSVRIFDTKEELRESLKGQGFICPKCEKVSTDSVECSQDDCDWKAYGLFRTLGKGVTVIVKNPYQQGHIFKPAAWE